MNPELVSTLEIVNAIKAPSDLLGKIIIAQQNQINALRQENAVLKARLAATEPQPKENVLWLANR